MGTSTARRAPTTKVWRQAKTAATRYLSAESSAPVTAGEVLARYLKALKEGPEPEAMAPFALARRIALNLGEFCQQAVEKNLVEALAPWQPADLLTQAPGTAAHSLAAAWLQGNIGLEEAALRPALICRLAALLKAFRESPTCRPAPEISLEVRTFLTDALYHRLVFDLGESLEAAAPGWRTFSAGLSGLKAELHRVSAALSHETSAPPDWQGLEGWLWVTRLLEGLLDHLVQEDLTSE